MTRAALGEVTLIQQGRYLAKDEMSDSFHATSRVPVHGANGIIGWTSSTMYDCGIPLVTCRGSNSGMVLWADGPLWVSNNAMAVQPRTNGDLKFLYYALLLQPPYSVVTGSAQPQITRRDLEKHTIFWPALPKQQAITSILGALDDKIDLNRRMNETLEAMARIIFKDWFVDFGPTRAKMEGRPPYLASDLWALFPDRLDAEGKPEGWEEGPLGVTAEVIMGASPDGATYNDQGNGTPLVNGPVEYGSYFLRKVKWTTAPTRMSNVGDFIICVRGSTTGRHCYADDDYCLGRGVAAVRSKEGNTEFVSETLLANMLSLLAKATGSVFPNISGEDIRELRIMLADGVTRAAFTKFTRPLKKRIWSNVLETESLAATRDLLLPKLMSGEIRMREAESLLGAVA